MKKILLFAVVAFASSAAFSQMAVSGGDFANHPERYENKPVTLNQVSVGEDQHGHGAPKGATHGAPCVAPSGTTKIPVIVNQNPEFHGCFYAQNAIATQILAKANGPQPVDMVLSIKGTQRSGYLITAYKVGH
jgi:hypothetical protein